MPPIVAVVLQMMGSCSSRNRSGAVQRLKRYIVLSKKMFVVIKAIQQCALGESPTPLLRGGLDTLRACPDTVLTRERAVTFDTALLT